MGRDLNFLPEITFVVSWAGGHQVLAVARTSSEAINGVRKEKHLSDDIDMRVSMLPPEQVYECEHHGMETIKVCP